MRKEFRGEFCVAYVRAGIVMNVIDHILDEAMVSEYKSVKKKQIYLSDIEKNHLTYNVV